MEEFIAVLLFFVLAAVLDRVMKAMKRKQGGVHPRSDWEEEGEEGMDELGEREVGVGGVDAQFKKLDSDLERLIAQELGLKTEEREAQRESSPLGPPVARRRPPPPSRRPTPVTLPKRPGAPAERGRQVVYPDAETAARARPIEPLRPALPARRRAAEVKSREPAAPSRPARTPQAERPAAPQWGAPLTLARRRGGRMLLPDSPSWSPMKKAIIWAEILGPPRGLVD